MRTSARARRRSPASKRLHSATPASSRAEASSSGSGSPDATFCEIVNRTLLVERLVAQVSTGFGLLALAIASVGLYGVLAYGVARRTREIGIRLAVGARPGTIERMILSESLAVVAIGIAVGIPGGVALARLGSSLLFGLGPHDPVALALAVGALTLTSLIATLLPARQAARVDPALVLRGE